MAKQRKPPIDPRFTPRGNAAPAKTSVKDAVALTTTTRKQIAAEGAAKAAVADANKKAAKLAPALQPDWKKGAGPKNSGGLIHKVAGGIRKAEGAANDALSNKGTVGKVVEKVTKAERKAAHVAAPILVAGRKGPIAYGGALLKTVTPKPVDKIIDKVTDPVGTGLSLAHKEARKVKVPVGTAAVGGGGGGTVSLGAIEDAAKKKLPKTPHVSVDKILTQGVERSLNDATDLTTNAIPSVYVPASEAVHGHVGKAAKMLAQPFVDVAKHPVKSITEHPLQTALLIRGGEGLVGHTAGRTLRTAGAVVDTTRRRAAAKAGAPRPEPSMATKLGSTRRPAQDAHVPGTKLRVQGRYSKDSIVKAGQFAKDRAQGRTAKSEPRVMTTHNRFGVGAGEQGRAANEQSGANEDIAREVRATRGRDTAKRIGKIHKTSPLHTIVQDNTIAPTRAAAEAYVEKLKAEGAKLTEPVMKEQNARSVRDLEKALAKKPDFNKIAAEVKDYREANRPVEQKRHALGLTDPAVERLAAHKPYAVNNMGARTPTEGELVHAVQKATENARVALSAGRRALDAGGTATKTDAAARVKRAADALRAAKAEEAAGGYLRDPQGQVLTAAQIAAHAKAHGHGEPLFISQAPGSGGMRAFRPARPSVEAPLVSTGKTRTGAATREGTFDMGGHTLHEQAVRKDLEVNAAERHRQTIDQAGVRNPDGTLFTRDTADRARRDAKNMSLLDPRVEWRAVRINPLQGRKVQLDATLEQVNHNTTHTEGITEALHNALKGNDRGPGPYALIPKTVADTLAEQQKPIGALGARFGSVWRKNVLAFSPKWLVGNAAEGALRTVIAGAGPGSSLTSRRVQDFLGQLSPEAERELRIRARGGGHYSLVDRNNVYVGDRGGLGRAIHEMGQQPGVRHLADVYNGWTNLVFHELNGRMESRLQSVMLGKVMRDHPLMDGHLFKASKAATEEFARALMDGDKPNVQLMAELGRAVDDMYGKYGKFGPRQRRMIASYTPFIAWSLNAVNFLFRVLPRDHPVLTGLLASANKASEEWRKDKGLVQWFTKNMGGAPDFLQGGIPGKDGTMLRVNRYTPFGITAANGGLLGNAEGLLLPQIQGIVGNLTGTDWKGKPLAPKGKANQGQNALAAGDTFLESLVPASAWIKAVTGFQGPNTSAADKKKPQGNVVDRLNKLANPGKYTDKPKTQATGGGGFGTSSSGGFGSGSAGGFGSGSSGGF